VTVHIWSPSLGPCGAGVAYGLRLPCGADLAAPSWASGPTASIDRRSLAAAYAFSARLGGALEQNPAIRYAERLDQIVVACSVGSKADSFDNAAKESLNRLYKKELIDFRGSWENFTDAILAVREWEACYNSGRAQSSCGTSRASTKERSTGHGTLCPKPAEKQATGLQHFCGGLMTMKISDLYSFAAILVGDRLWSSDNVRGQCSRRGLRS
jgi:hypothetical protein